MCNMTKSVTHKLNSNPTIDFVADPNKNLIQIPNGATNSYVGRNGKSFEYKS